MITVQLTSLEISLTLDAVRHAHSVMHAPQLEAVIDVLQAALTEAESGPAEPSDGFFSDAEADADALASAGHGTDEDYYPAEGDRDYYSVYEDDQY